MSKPPDESSRSKPRKRKRRWLRRLAILLVVLAALALAVNGPIARWLVGKVLTDQLAKQGLEGTVTVEGRLWSGFTLKDATFEGDEAFVRVKFDELSVHYSLPELRDKKIRRVHGRGVEVELTLKEKEAKPAGTGPDKPEFGKMAETLGTLRKLLAPVAIELEEVGLTLNRPAGDPLEISFGALDHEAGANLFQFTALSSNALGAQGLPSQDLAVRWSEHRLQLGAVEVLPELALNEATISYAPGDPVSLDASVRAAAADLDLAADETGRIALNLENGPLDVGEIVEAYDPDLVLDATVSRLQVTAHNLWEGAEDWTARIDFDATDLRWPGGGGLSRASLRLTGDQDLALSLSAGTDLELEASAPRPVLAGRPLGSLWKDLLVTLELRTPSLHTTLREVFAAIGPKTIELANVPEGAATVTGTLTTGGQLGIAPADLKWSLSDGTFQEKPLPDLAGNASLAEGVATATATLAQPRPEESLQLSAAWTLDTRSYEGNLTARLPDPEWLGPFLPGDGPEWKPVGPIAVTWEGTGAFPADAEPRHTGRLVVSELTVTAPDDTATRVALEGSYEWPAMVELASLSLRNDDLWLEGAVQWSDDRLAVRALRLHDQTGPLTSLEGSVPLALDTLALDKYLTQDAPLDLALNGRGLELQRLRQLLPLNLPEGFSATLGYDLALGGTPGAPTLDGSITATEIGTPGPDELPVMAATLNFATADQRLTATGEITEPGGKLADLRASVPIRLEAWVEDPEQFKQLPLDISATVQQLALSRLQIFAPALADAEGTVAANVSVTGPVGKPALAGGATVDLARYPLPDTPFREVYDSRLAVRLDDSRIVIEPGSVINCAGGQVVLAGSVGLQGEQPQLDINVTADHLLAWRNDSVILRCNASLAVDGPLDAARITGEVDIVESVFYKDIDLLPVGVPTASVPEPQLPKIDQQQAAQIVGMPAPFGNWALNVAVRTRDPILIRGGNFATGRVNANARVGGTLASPRPTGTITIQDAWARLPLSGKLNVRQGIVTLRPDAPYNPVLDLRGAATVGRYNITVNVFGTASSPQYNLFSDPPLPESEILTLLATGTTTADLEDRENATMRGVQLMINMLKDRFQKPGRDTPVQRILAGLDEIELDVGENDPFSGRKLNSATLQVSDRWFLSAAVDGSGNTRGVVIFSVRFR